jgi:hypothetical protein
MRSIGHEQSDVAGGREQLRLRRSSWCDAIAADAAIAREKDPEVDASPRREVAHRRPGGGVLNPVPPRLTRRLPVPPLASIRGIAMSAPASAQDSNQDQQAGKEPRPVTPTRIHISIEVDITEHVCQRTEWQ